MADRLLLTVPEAAQWMNVGRDYLYREVRRGALRSVKVGRRRLVSQEACLDWVREKEHGV